MLRRYRLSKYQGEQDKIDYRLFKILEIDPIFKVVVFLVLGIFAVLIVLFVVKLVVVGLIVGLIPAVVKLVVILIIFVFLRHGYTLLHLCFVCSSHKLQKRFFHQNWFCKTETLVLRLFSM